MQKDVLSNEEKKRLSNERQNAVRKAWKAERERVEKGYCTRNWSEEEKKELLERGAVSGYEGHHMKAVSLYPEEAGNPKNIQCLTEDEHLYGAHNGDYHNQTNGYYDPDTNKMINFSGSELVEVPERPIGENDEQELDKARQQYISDYDNDTAEKENSKDAVSVSETENESQDEFNSDSEGSSESEGAGIRR